MVALSFLSQRVTGTESLRAWFCVSSVSNKNTSLKAHRLPQPWSPTYLQLNTPDLSTQHFSVGTERSCPDLALSMTPQSSVPPKNANNRIWFSCRPDSLALDWWGFVSLWTILERTPVKRPHLACLLCSFWLTLIVTTQIYLNSTERRERNTTGLWHSPHCAGWPSLHCLLHL